MVARTPREILRWLEGLYLTYPIVVPKWDLSNGFAFAEILHAYFPRDINMLAFINGRSLNARLLNWSLIKQFLAKKKVPIPIEYIDATLHGKDGGAEGLLEYTYQLLTNKTPFIDPPYERDENFSDHPYQQNLKYYEQAHASKSIKNNIKISELLTDPSYAYQGKRSKSLLEQAHADRQALRALNPTRFRVKPTLAERCLREPLRPESNPQEWYMKSFDSRSRSAASTTNKSNSVKQASRHTSADLPKKSASFHKEQIEGNEENALYKEIILRQHAVPLGDLLQTTES